MSHKYIQVPKIITLEDCIENNYCFAPSKYTRFTPNKNVNFKTLDSLCQESLKKEKIKKSNVYNYSEIGNIEVSTGYIEAVSSYGIKIPSVNPKQIQKNDILISTVRTYRGGVGFVNEDLSNHICTPAIMVLREIDTSITKEYLFAVLRTDFFIEQILGFQNRGMYPRIERDTMKYIYVPIPKSDDVIEYITIIVKAYLNKLTLIKQRHQTILETIERELKQHQKPNKFKFDYPSINEIIEGGRLDTNLYSEKFKKIDFLIKNYQSEFKTIFDYGFTLSRGQNLQVSNIGKSIYSTKYYDNFYTLMLPTFLSKYGTVNTIEYLGNAKNLKTLEKGDLIIGAEGFEKGRSIVIIEDKEKNITNIHGITIQQHNKNLTTSIFIKCCLDYLRDKGLVDLFAVGGNGGSLAQKYWEYIPFPNFEDDKQKEIAKLYHNAGHNYEISQCTLDNFLLTDHAYNETAGIHELDKTAKQLKAKLNQTIDDIINDKEVDVSFDF